jgi:hypothetical protein
MAISSEHVLHGILNSSTFISQVSSSRPSPGIETILGTPAGFQYPVFVGNIGQRPMLSFDSTQVKTILDLTGIGIADLSAANTDIYFKQADHLGIRIANATTSHTRLRAAQAALVAERISVGHRSEASASCRMMFPYDGSNEPIVPAGSVAVSGTSASAEHFVQGPVYLNTVQLTGVQDMTIDFGITIKEAGGEGELYDTFVCVMEIRPVITIRCENLPWATFGLNGTALTAGSFYLRKVATTGRVSNATSEHIKFAATAGLITIDDSSAGDNDAVISTVRCALVAPSASGAPLTVNTAIAITT